MPTREVCTRVRNTGLGASLVGIGGLVERSGREEPGISHPENRPASDVRGG